MWLTCIKCEIYTNHRVCLLTIWIVVAIYVEENILYLIRSSSICDLRFRGLRLKPHPHDYSTFFNGQAPMTLLTSSVHLWCH
jgi:hypothetical protein